MAKDESIGNAWRLRKKINIDFFLINKKNNNSNQKLKTSSISGLLSQAACDTTLLLLNQTKSNQQTASIAPIHSLMSTLFLKDAPMCLPQLTTMS